MFYDKELKAIKRKGIFRERKLFSKNLIDLASNDYLGISENLELFETAFKYLKDFGEFSPKASMLVNGYSEIHQNLENLLSKIHNFENSIILGSGFLANFGLLESLVRNGDEVFMDSEYHSSGMVATKLLRKNQVNIFSHNSISELETLLQTSSAKRKIIAVEGIYSMSGDLMKKEIFEIADRFGAILIVDEAHSFGTVGNSLLGVFDLFNIQPKPNHIKMGTFGKAVGSYGAYILASAKIISFLENRSKPIIYSTAPSLFDTALAHKSILHILQNIEFFKDSILERKQIFEKVGILKEGLIYPISIETSQKTLEIQNELKDNGFLVGAIRPPTVEKPILRVILRANISIQNIEKLILLISARI